MISKQSGLRVCTFSSLFPSIRSPNAGIFIRERMFRVAREFPLVVVAPQAWSPFDWIVRMVRPDFRPMDLRSEIVDGINILRPRYLSIPSIGKRFDGFLMATSCLPSMRRLHRTFGFTVIDAHFAYPDGHAAVRIGRALSVPVVVSLRGSKDERLIGTSREKGLRWALSKADALISVSEKLRIDVVERLGIKRPVTLIGNGIDLVRFSAETRNEARERLGLPLRAKVMVGVGNLIPLKGFQRVIPLLPRLRERYPDLIYLIVGDAAQQADIRRELVALARDWGVLDAVRFAGRQPQEELKWYYSAADLFVLATEYEGWANVFLEAMSCGLPVITTRVGGNSEVVPEGVAGTLVDYWDPDAFGKAIDDGLSRSWDHSAIQAYARSQEWPCKISILTTLLQQVSSTKPRPS